MSPSNSLSARSARRTVKRFSTLFFAFAVVVVLTAAFFYVSTRAAGTTYFSRADGLPPELTASWSTTPDGLGAPPPNFTSGDTFVIQNGHNLSTLAAWSISGAGSKLRIENGGTLTANNAVTLAAATTFQIDGGGTYVHNNNTAFGSSIFQGIESFAPTSTVILNNSSGTGPTGVAFGNLTVNTPTLAGSVQCNGGITTINGNLTIISTNAGAFNLSANTPTP
jgi:hypothetical protein